MVSLSGGCRCHSEALKELGAPVKTHGRWTGPKLLIGITLTSCNYSPEILSYSSGFNKPAITQPTIIITRTIKRDGYSLVKRSHMLDAHSSQDTGWEMDTNTARGGQWELSSWEWGGRVDPALNPNTTGQINCFTVTGPTVRWPPLCVVSSNRIPPASDHSNLAVSWC